MNRPDNGARITPVAEADLASIARLARDIWYRHYPGIITVAQIEYMLDQRYRPQSIRDQLANAAAWWDKLQVGGRIIGFTAYEPGAKPGSVKLDKLYVHQRFQGRGYGSMLLRHVESIASSRGAATLYLQVNKNNSSSIAMYRRNGYTVSEEGKFDIGGGFVMDDYIMAKPLARHAA